MIEDMESYEKLSPIVAEFFSEKEHLIFHFFISKSDFKI